MLVGGLVIVLQFGHFEGPKKRLQAYLKELVSNFQ